MSRPVGLHNADCRLICASLGLHIRWSLESAAGNCHAPPSCGSDKSIVSAAGSCYATPGSGPDKHREQSHAGSNPDEAKLARLVHCHYRIQPGTISIQAKVRQADGGQGSKAHSNWIWKQMVVIWMPPAEQMPFRLNDEIQA